ncbi:uncharacterized protein [Patagioenas fasciata]|uniref:uncharacterized protein n=1 Tax=Patagioenas fasciata TaxID=372321 RepID=UPI003A99C9F1
MRGQRGGVESSQSARVLASGSVVSRGGAVNARCSADPPAQAGNGTWGAAPGWETRHRPPSPACGRGAGGDSRPGADAGGRAEDVAVRSQPGGCRWLRPPRAGEARLAAWREKGQGSTSRAWTGAAAAGAREVGERLRTAERPELPERKGGEKETGASELLEASWQPPKARAAAVSQPEDPLCPAAGPVEPRTLLAHPGDVSGETPRLGRIAAGTDEDLCGSVLQSVTHDCLETAEAVRSGGAD